MYDCYIVGLADLYLSVYRILFLRQLTPTNFLGLPEHNTGTPVMVAISLH